MNVYNLRFLRIRPIVQDLFYGLQQLQSLFFWHWYALVLKSIKIVLIIEHTYFSHYTLKFTTQG